MQAANIRPYSRYERKVRPPLAESILIVLIVSMAFGLYLNLAAPAEEETFDGFVLENMATTQPAKTSIARN